MQKNEILKIYGTEYKEMTRTLLEAAGLAGLIGRKNARIGLKPNLVSPTPAEYGATTHPEVVAGIIEYLQDHGFRNIVIAEGAWVGDRTSEAFEYCGYRALSEEYGVPLIDTQKDKSVRRSCAGMDIRICRCVEQMDFLINIPVLKGHCQTGITCALKNLKGLIPNSEKRRFHILGLHKPIAHLNAGIRQDFIVVDHICGDPEIEDGGHPLVTNCIMAARDPVLTDSYVCSLLHCPVKRARYVSLAEELGIGSADLSGLRMTVLDEQDRGEISRSYRVTGDSEADGEIPRNFRVTGDSEADGEIPRSYRVTGDSEADGEIPRNFRMTDISEPVEEIDSCSACRARLAGALDRLEKEGLLNRIPCKISVGQGFRGKTGELGIGSCTAGFRHTLPGCPPGQDEIYHFLKDYLSYPESRP